MNPSPVSETRTVLLADLVPYWRNPRLITDEAVNAVAESIRQFGYNQPIVVDPEMVIIAGHTRYSALRRLGYEEVDVLVASGLSQQQVKQLRLIDNRTSELGIWDFEKLVDEMSGLDATLMTQFFPDLAPGVFSGEQTTVEVELDTGMAEQFAGDAAGTVEFVCPACFHMWERAVSRSQIESGILAPLEEEDR